MPGTVLDRVSEGKLSYFDHQLPTLPLGSDAVRIVLTRGNETLELERSKAADGAVSWKIKAPKEMAGRTVEPGKLNRILHDFSSLVAEKLVADKVTDNDLERFGLKTPSAKIVFGIEKDKKPEEQTFLLGKETDDKQGYYAKSGTKDLVFVLRKAIWDDLQGDLQDATVLHLDLSKVRGMKITGWQDVIGAPITLDLLRKSATDWQVKAPPDYKLDAAVAESFLAGLNGMKALRFVSPRGGPKPEQKFDLKDGGLQIVLTVDGEKEPITIQVGAKTAEGWYVMCSKLPQEVFLVPLDRFEKVKSKPAYFKKDS